VFAAIINSGDTGAHMICLLSDIVVNNLSTVRYCSQYQKDVLCVINVNNFAILYDLYLPKQYNKNYLCRTLSENVSDLSVFD